MIKHTDDCYGCKACVSICPKKCLTVDINGTLQSNPDNCIECGLCEKVCQIDNAPILNKSLHVFAACLRDTLKLEESSSGGIGGLLIEWALRNEYVVFTAITDDNCLPLIVKVDNSVIAKAKKSKYCFSDTNNTFTECKKELNAGNKVLYMALPCQIAGLRLFLRNEYENLLTVDIFCHGAPAQSIFIRHLRYKSKNRKVIDFQFRDKHISRWGDYSYGIKYEGNKMKAGSGLCDAYYSQFIKGTIFRKSCYSCYYATEKRIGDLSIGDFWNVNEWSERFKDCNGVSAIMANTKNGITILETLKEHLLIEVSNISQLQRSTHAVLHPMNIGNRNDKLISMNNVEYEKWARKYENQPINLLRKSKRMINNFYTGCKKKLTS